MPYPKGIGIMETVYRIRTAIKEDEERIRELFTEMMRTVHGNDNVKGYDEGYLDRFWSGGEDIIFVAEEDIVVGFLSVEIHREERDYAYLDDFSVEGSHRNMGIGTRLLSAAETYARETGVSALLLHVEKRNLGAYELYRRAGYTVFRDDGNRLLMKKDI